MNNVHYYKNKSNFETLLEMQWSRETIWMETSCYSRCVWRLQSISDEAGETASIEFITVWRHNETHTVNLRWDMTNVFWFSRKKMVIVMRVTHLDVRDHARRIGMSDTTGDEKDDNFCYCLLYLNFIATIVRTVVIIKFITNRVVVAKCKIYKSKSWIWQPSKSNLTEVVYC
jgi:hypothetical protein